MLKPWLRVPQQGLKVADARDLWLDLPRALVCVRQDRGGADLQICEMALHGSQGPWHRLGSEDLAQSSSPEEALTVVAEGSHA